MDSYIKQFIRSNEEDINNNEWDDLYVKFNPGLEYLNLFGALLDILHAADIYPENFLTGRLPYCFAFGSNLDEVIINATIKYISEECFSGCSNLKKVIIPSTVHSIEGWAFSNCNDLEEVVIEEGVEILGGYVFTSCPKLKSIILPKSIKIMGNQLFTDSSQVEVYYQGIKADLAKIRCNGSPLKGLAGIQCSDGYISRQAGTIPVLEI